MTSFRLKVLAYISMFVDHIGFLFFTGAPLFILFGRLALPLFAFFIAEGVHHTRNGSKYVLRLIIFGCIAQWPYHYLRAELGGVTIPQLNILFTLAVSLICLLFIRQKKYTYLLLTVISFAFIEHSIHFEYGWYGIATTFAMYSITEGRKFLGSLLFVLLTVAQSMILAPFDLQLQIVAIFALIPIIFYNKLLGYKINKWLLYSIYPAHIIILILVYKLLGF